MSIYLGPLTVTMYSTLFITPQSGYRDVGISVSYSARYTYAHTNSNMFYVIFYSCDV